MRLLCSDQRSTTDSSVVVVGLNIFHDLSIGFDFPAGELQVGPSALPEPDGKTIFAYADPANPLVPVTIGTVMFDALVSTGQIRSPILVTLEVARQIRTVHRSVDLSCPFSEDIKSMGWMGAVGNLLKNYEREVPRPRRNRLFKTFSRSRSMPRSRARPELRSTIHRIQARSAARPSGAVLPRRRERIALRRAGPSPQGSRRTRSR